jgi:hypothetical protein
VWKLIKWFDVGADWKLGFDRFLITCCVLILVNHLLDILYVLPVEDSKSLFEFLKSSIPFAGDD